jgi:glycosyltransferase involved in cell wall biosynthesis
MRVLFVHQNFPGQYLHLAPALAKAGHEVVALTVESNKRTELVRTVRYPFDEKAIKAWSPLSAHFTSHAARGEAVARKAQELKRDGFTPDVICGHLGWGETLFLKDIWPQAKMLVYAEFFYNHDGADVGFDPEFAREGEESRMRTTSRTASLLTSMHVADRGLAPTEWQASQWPAGMRERISIIHDGVDTRKCAPNRNAFVKLGRNDLTLKPGDEVVTFINRNLEPYRGYHVFMRALPRIMRERPNARVIIVGGDQVSYGAAPPQGKTWKNIFLGEVQNDLDMERVHFVGRVPYDVFVNLMQVTAAHVYLTYPFVLSWSMLEAMACGALIIGSRTPPVEEVLKEGENGLLVDFFDKEGIADAVIGALARQSAFQHLRAGARRTVAENYDLSTVCLPRHIELVEKLARNEI